jgi:hypothetical protein
MHWRILTSPAFFNRHSEGISMRKASRLPASFILSAALVLCCSIVNLAQKREKFVISAKAGGINAITGGATVYPRGESDWHQLSITDDLESGDRVRTAYDGRVEILLNPGSYLRLGGNSEVELLNNTLENLEVKLLRGTAIVEATGADGLELNIGISTPHTRLAIVRQGLYRLNVVPEDATELIVRKGRVVLSDSQKVKGGNKVVFNATNVSVAKLTKEEKKLKVKEEVDLWSKERAETLAKANRRISERMLNSAFASFRDNDPFSRGRFGFWFYNTHARCYTFLPFYYGWGSPYGNSYSTSVYYTPINNSFPRTGSNGNTGGGSFPSGNNGGGTPSGGGGGTYRPAPPPSSAPSGGLGNGPVSRPAPRVDPDGARMPRKSLERLPN